MIEKLLTRYTRHACRGYMHLDELGSRGQRPEPVPGIKPLLYVHVPFCRSLCPFCTFHRIRYTGPRAERYFAALRDEIRRYHDLGFEFEEVYVGGGTPTIDPNELVETLEIFFEQDCCPSQTANALIIHRNTLSYRLDKITSLTGLDVREFDDAVQVRLALLLRSFEGEDKLTRHAA